MNDPEVTMSNALTNTNLAAFEKALEAASVAITLAMRVPAPLKSIADQVIRSASSVPANLAEGHGRSGRDRLHFWRIAYASAKEVDSHLRLLAQAGVVNGIKADRALTTFDQCPSHRIPDEPNVRTPVRRSAASLTPCGDTTSPIVAGRHRHPKSRSRGTDSRKQEVSLPQFHC